MNDEENDEVQLFQLTNDTIECKIQGKTLRQRKMNS